MARTTWYGPRINHATAHMGVEERRIAEKTSLGNVWALRYGNDDLPFLIDGLSSQHLALLTNVNELTRALVSVEQLFVSSR